VGEALAKGKGEAAALAAGAHNLRVHGGFFGDESSPSSHVAARLRSRERSRGSHHRRGKTEKRLAKVAQKRCWRQQGVGSLRPGARRM
jgi:hypothetical protein